MDFFGPDAPVKAGREGVMIVRYSDGRASGDALVLFDNDRDLDRAMEKNRQSMGSRYVELYKSSLKEFQMVYRHAIAACMWEFSQEKWVNVCMCRFWPVQGL